MPMTGNLLGPMGPPPKKCPTLRSVDRFDIGPYPRDCCPAHTYERESRLVFQKVSDLAATDSP
jgi:hypothetical protein